MISPSDLALTLRRIWDTDPPVSYDDGTRSYPVLRRWRFLWWRWSTVERWLWIDDDGADWFVTVASGPRSHDALSGPAYGCYVDKGTGELSASRGWTGAWRTALSMWPIRDEADARLAYGVVAAAVARAGGGRSCA